MVWVGGIGYLETPYERDCYLGVPRFESQTTGPQANTLLGGGFIFFYFHPPLGK